MIVRTSFLAIPTTGLNQRAGPAQSGSPPFCEFESHKSKEVFPPQACHAGGTAQAGCGRGGHEKHQLPATRTLGQWANPPEGLGSLILRLVKGYSTGRYVSVSSSNSHRAPSMSTAVKSSEGSSADARPLSIISRT